jgi:hypothetical protein
MADATITVTVPLDRLPAVSAAILGVIDSPDQMTVERVEDTRRPARSADWQTATREFFKRYNGEWFTTAEIVGQIHKNGVRIDRATVSRYLSHLVAQGYLKPKGDGRYRSYRINPITMTKES